MGLVRYYSTGACQSLAAMLRALRDKPQGSSNRGFHFDAADIAASAMSEGAKRLELRSSGLADYTHAVFWTVPRIICRRADSAPIFYAGHAPDSPEDIAD